MGIPKEMTALAREARSQGWTVELARSGHLHWVSPTGALVTTAATPRSPVRTLRNARADLRRAGLDTTQKSKTSRTPRPTKPQGAHELTITTEAPVSRNGSAGFTTPTGESVEVKTITVTIAGAWLERNQANRKIRQRAVDRYAADMANNTWRFTGESVKLDDAGNILDGQHRLLACVQAGKSFQTLVITGVKGEAQANMDSGVPRSVADMLRWRGEIDAFALAGSIGMFYRWMLGETGASRGLRPTNDQMADMLARNPGLREAVRIKGRFKELRIAPSAIAPVIHMILIIEPELGEKFLAGLATGVNLGESDPAFMFRRWALNRAIRRERTEPVVYMAMLIKSWNLWVMGKTVNQLVWRHGGENSELFPVMLNAAGVECPPRNQIS